MVPHDRATGAEERANDDSGGGATCRWCWARDAGPDALAERNDIVAAAGGIGRPAPAATPATAMSVLPPGLLMSSDD